MIKARWFARYGSVVAILATVAACVPAAPQASAPGGGAAQPKSEPVKLTIAYTSVSPASAVWWVTKESGSWAKYGLEVDLKLIEGGNLLVQALLGGSMRITSGPLGDSLAASAAGNTDLVSLSLNTDRLTDVLVVTPDINSAADLKGKKVGISEAGGEGDFTMVQSLKLLGLDPTKDVTRLAVGTEGPRLAGLQARTISAGMLDVSQEPEIKQLGLKVLVRLSDQDLPWAKQGVLTTRTFLRENRDLATRFMKGYLEGIAFYKNPKNREASMGYISNYMKKDPAVIAQAYDAYTALQERKPLVKREALEKTREFMTAENPNMKTLDVATTFDNSLLEEIDKSGFIDALYK